MPKGEYEENFKKSLVTLYLQGVNVRYICKKYGVLRPEIDQWIKQYAGEKLESTELNFILQLRELKKQKASLEKEINLLDEAIRLLQNS
ncbi:helix-turn-helix domain-containing protein [Listeria monocytogenes]|nr:helix-turn-helix domain-containing protein [Listeria monocytogenes]EAD6504761.1 helix-turn-helix domain-containing protein [Listeria monocytogenes]